MSITIRVPAPLRNLTEDQSKILIDASTISGLIEELESLFPGMKDRLVDEKGELRYFVNLYLNGEDVRFLNGVDTAVNSGDELSIVPAVAGG
ncbi:MoaD/ThiS family protein [SAR202 cluster bacterium AC-409-J13_OGT_754m]|nr:MoaD/ThiS family protein [SAR202 cluster bacterium AC-409-J13_OGT_754m]